jgi:hypothetical protein
VTVRPPSLRTNKKLIVRALAMVCTRTKGDKENSRTIAIEVATVTKITRNEYRVTDLTCEWYNQHQTAGLPTV